MNPCYLYTRTLLIVNTLFVLRFSSLLFFSILYILILFSFPSRSLHFPFTFLSLSLLVPFTFCSLSLLVPFFPPSLSLLFPVSSPSLLRADVPCNPVTVAYSLVTTTEANLYIDANKVPDEVRAALQQQVDIHYICILTLIARFFLFLTFYLCIVSLSLSLYCFSLAISICIPLSYHPL